MMFRMWLPFVPAIEMVRPVRANAELRLTDDGADSRVWYVEVSCLLTDSRTSDPHSSGLASSGSGKEAPGPGRPASSRR